MRKLRLVIQISLDGFAAGSNGEEDWIWLAGPDPAVPAKIVELAGECDTLLLGRKMAPNFITYWENVVDNQPDSPQQPLAQAMVKFRKIVFSRTQSDIKGRNVEVENNDLVTAVHALKEQPGKDITVYGGVDFVSSLISHNLIDEYYFFINPVALGNGQTLFKGRKLLKLESSIAFQNGKVLNKYLQV